MKMTCKDCIHYDICVFHLKGNENEKCLHFKNNADLVEVVRCKDCEHWEATDDGVSWNNKGRTDGACERLWSIHYAERHFTEQDHYCGYGRHKTQKECVGE